MMCLSLVLVVMSVSGLVTAIPTMQEELNTSASQIQWILDAYAIVFAGLAAHRRRARRPLRPQARAARRPRGVRVGSLFAGLASSAAQVIAGRAVMGIGAALVMPATLSIITTIFPPEERHRAIARVGRLRRRRRRDRTDRVRRAARALLVGFRGARQPAARRGHVRRDLDLRARVARRVGDAARPGGRGALARRARRARVRDHPGRRERLDDDAGGRRGRRRARSRSPAFVRWERRSAHPMLPLDLLPRPALQRRQRASSPSRSS